MSSNLVGCMTGKIAGLLAFENPSRIAACLAKNLGKARAIPRN